MSDQHEARIAACLSACEDMKDPVAEVRALRDVLAEMECVLITAIGQVVLDHGDDADIVQQLRKARTALEDKK